MSRPAISVCVPAYNAAAWIGATVDSVLAQTRGDFELVILDDRSADDTLAVLRRYDDPRIRLLVNERNTGAEAAWNRVLAEARGEFVKLLCCDDILYPDCLERQARRLEDPAHPGIGVVSGPRDIIDEAGRMLVRRRGLARPAVLHGRDVVRRMVASGRNLLGEPLTVLFRRDLVRTVGGFRATEPYCIDVDMWCRLLAVSDLAVVPDPVGAFRVSLSAWSFRLAGRQAAQDRAFFARVRNALVPEVPGWRVWLGQARCTRDAFLRQVLYAWLRWRGSGYIPGPRGSASEP